MGKLEGRVTALEAHKGAHDMYTYPWHRITQHEGQSEAEAIDTYGREKIGPNDNLIVTTLVSPKFDAEGRLIPQRKTGVGLRRGAGVLGYGAIGGDNGTA